MKQYNHKKNPSIYRIDEGRRFVCTGSTIWPSFETVANKFLKKAYKFNNKLNSLKNVLRQSDTRTIENNIRKCFDALNDVNSAIPKGNDVTIYDRLYNNVLVGMYDVKASMVLRLADIINDDPILKKSYRVVIEDDERGRRAIEFRPLNKNGDVMRDEDGKIIAYAKPHMPESLPELQRHAAIGRTGDKPNDEPGANNGEQYKPMVSTDYTSYIEDIQDAIPETSTAIDNKTQQEKMIKQRTDAQNAVQNGKIILANDELEAYNQPVIITKKNRSKQVVGYNAAENAHSTDKPLFTTPKKENTYFSSYETESDDESTFLTFFDKEGDVRGTVSYDKTNNTIETEPINPETFVANAVNEDIIRNIVKEELRKKQKQMANEQKIKRFFKDIF